MQVLEDWDQETVLINQDVYKRQAFVESPIAPRMAAAAVRGDLYRERPFVMQHQICLLYTSRTASGWTGEFRRGNLSCHGSEF